MQSTLADICDREALARALDRHRPQIVIHLAAQAIVGRAHADAYETWRVNALGTVALLEALRGRDSVRALSVFTTDKVYDNNETGHAHREDDAIGGLGIYDSSKGAAELAVRAFRHAGAATVRAGNVIGGGDWSEARLVPDCIRAFAQGKPVALRHPQSIRPWQHVLDVCAATLKLTQALYHKPAEFAGGWNIGPDAGEAASAASIAETLAAQWKQEPAWEQASDAASFPEANILRLDSAKLQKALGWRPALKLADALAWTGEWYRAWQDAPGEARATSLRQVEAFEKRSA